MFNFSIIDPRSIPAAVEANEKVFSSGPVYGIEVTVPALAARCIENLDPQHAGQNADLAAIEAALTCELPPDGATLATVRPDLDAVGAMAVLLLRQEGMLPPIGVYTSCEIKHYERTDLCEMEGGISLLIDRVGLIAEADKFARGAWSPKTLPTTEKPWPAGGSAESTQELAVMNAAVADFKVPLAQRVETMKVWLLTGEEPAQYQAQVEKERQDLIGALENGQIKHDAKDGIATVVSTHRAATMVGYALAPVVIALNPEFKFQGGPAHAKFTVCQHQAGFVDLKAAAEDLNALEFGTDWRAKLAAAVAAGKGFGIWGGSPTIIGSPQGIPTIVQEKEVEEVVRRHLIKK